MNRPARLATHLAPTDRPEQTAARNERGGVEGRSAVETLYRAFSIIALGLVMSAGTACNRTKVAQCNRLIQTVNQQEERLRPQMNQTSQSGDPAQIDALAAAFERSGREINSVQLTDPQLQNLSRQYQAVITRFVTVSRAMAAAARAQNPEGIQAAMPQLTAIENESNAVTDRINQYCGAQ